MGVAARSQYLHAARRPEVYSNDGDKNLVPGQPLFPAWTTRPPLRTSAVEGRPVEGPSLAEAAELHLVRFCPHPPLYPRLKPLATNRD